MLKPEERFTKEFIDRLDAEYDGRILHAWQAPLPRRTTPPAGSAEWECIFRAPNRREYLVFQKQNDDAVSIDTRALSIENLARSCILAVAGSEKTKDEAFDALLEKYPGIPSFVQSGLAKLAGFDIKDLEK